MATCPTCNAEATGSFCSTCGAALAPEAPSTANPPAPPVAPPTAPPASAPVSQPPAEYATWLRRVAGSLIDGLVLGIPLLVLLVAGFASVSSTMHWRCIKYSNGTSWCRTVPDSNVALVGGGILIALGVLWALAWTVYVIVAIGGPRGATVGMRAVKIYCVRDLTFDQVGMGKSFLRLVVTSLLGIIWIGSLIDDLFPLWDPKRQTLHDKAVDTVVLRTGT